MKKLFITICMLFLYVSVYSQINAPTRDTATAQRTLGNIVTNFADKQLYFYNGFYWDRVSFDRFVKQVVFNGTTGSLQFVREGGLPPIQMNLGTADDYQRAKFDATKHRLLFQANAGYWDSLDVRWSIDSGVNLGTTGAQIYAGLTALPNPKHQFRRIISGSPEITVTENADDITLNFAGGSGSGTVLSVGIAAPPTEFTVSGSPVTTSGTLTLGWQNQDAHKVLIGPVTGSPSAPNFRLLAKADLPALTTDDITEGTTNKYDRTVALSGTGGITITGTYPNFTIDGSGGGSGGDNNYPTSLTFGTSTGILTLGRNGLTDLTVDLDGRYIENEGDPVWSSVSNNYWTKTELANGSAVVDWTSIVNAPSFITTETDPTVPAHVKAITAGNITNWNAAYNDKINSIGFTGTTSKTLTLTQQDAGILTASFTDDNNFPSSAAFNVADGILTLGRTGLTALTVDLDGRYLINNQTINLTGDVTGSGTSAITTTIANNVVTYAKMQDIATNSLIGRYTTGTGDPQTVTVGAGLNLTAGTLTATGVQTESDPIANAKTVTINVGAGLSRTGAASQALSGNPAFTLTNTAPDQVVSIVGAGTVSVSGTYPNFTVTGASGGGGTVTSVGLTMPNIFSVAGSPVTGSGTLAASLVSQTANTVFSVGPTNGVPTFRLLAATDIPTLTVSKLSDFVTGVRSNISSGIGLSWNSGTGVMTNIAPDVPVVLTAGTNIGITGTYPNFTITNTAPGVTTPGLPAVLAVDNSALNSITLGASGNSTGYSYFAKRNLSSVNYTGSWGLGIDQTAFTLVMSNDANAASNRLFYIPALGTAPLFSPDNGTTKYTVLHTGNHVAGAAFTPTLTGANVLASLTTNAAGHVTGATTRALTPGDIGAAPSSGSGNYIQNQNAVIQTASAAISGGIRADGKSLFASTTGIRGTSTGMANTAYFSFYETGGNTRQAFIGKGSAGNNNLYVLSDIGAVHVAAGTVFNSTISDGYALQIVQNAATGTTIGNDGTYSYIQSWSRPLKINNQGNNTLINPNTGNVGLGTDNPIFKFHVNSGNSATAVVGQSSTPLGASSGAFLGAYATGLPTMANQRLGGLAIGTNNSGGIFRAGAFISAFSGSFWTTDVSHPTYLSFQTTNTGESAPIERMRITSDGKVAINTTSVDPAVTLHVNGNTTTDGVRSQNGNDLTLWAQGGTNMNFAVGAGTNDMVLDEDGRLGIGVQPSAIRGSLLEVAGNVWAEDAYILGLGAVPIAEFGLSGDVFVRTLGTENLRLSTPGPGSIQITQSTGNVSIGSGGSASNPPERLYVVGNMQSTGTAIIGNLPARASAATVFLTHTGGVLQTRTAAQVLADIGAGTSDPTLQQVTTNGNTTNRLIQITHQNSVPLSGSGLELFAATDGSQAYVQGRNRTGGLYIPVNITGGTTTVANILTVSSDLTFAGSTVWRASNHPAGGPANNATFTGASVPALIANNAAGHITSITSRTLTPGDIGAAPASSSGNYIQNQFSAAQTANAWISGMFRSNTGYEYRTAAGSGGYNMVNASGSLRWVVRGDGTESGANTGYDYSIIRRADDGSTIGTGLSINRASGDVSIPSALTVGDRVTSFQYFMQKRNGSNIESNAGTQFWHTFGGYQMYTDPEFRLGNNGLGTYNNSGGAAVQLFRENDVLTEAVPNASGYYLRVQVRPGLGPITPNLGGVSAPFTTAENQVYVTRIRAKLPVGYQINVNFNAYGTGQEAIWLTRTDGTGQWEDYIVQWRAGYTGTFSSINYFSISGASANIDWYIASFDVKKQTQAAWEEQTPTNIATGRPTRLYLNNDNTFLSQGSSNTLSLNIAGNVTEYGPVNTTYNYFTTTSANHYMNKPLRVETQIAIHNSGTWTTYLTQTEGRINNNIIWHAGNHPDGNAYNTTFTGALVPATLVTNAAGHVTGFTTRSLTPGDIGAIPEAPNTSSWSGWFGISQARFVASATGAPTTNTFYGIHMPGDANNGAQLAFRDNTAYFRTQTAGVVGSWVGLAPASGSGNYIQNQFTGPQSAAFIINGIGRSTNQFSVAKDGANTIQNSLTLYNAAVNRGVNFQLNAAANPGLTTWVHNGTSWIKRAEHFADNGMLRIHGDGGEALSLYRATSVASSATGGVRFDAINNGAAITTYGQIWGVIESNVAGNENGAIAFNTVRAGSVTEKMRISSSGAVSLSNIPAMGSAASTFLTSNAGVISSRTAAQVRSDIGAGTGNGTVTSVALSSTDLSVSGSPITTSGTITANVNNNAITFAKMQDVPANTLMGRYTTGTGDPQSITVGSGLFLNSAGVLSATGGSGFGAVFTARWYVSEPTPPGGGEMFSTTVPPNDLSVNGNTLRIEYNGRYPSSTTRALGININGNSVYTFSQAFSDATDGAWRMSATIIRVSNTTIKIAVTTYIADGLNLPTPVNVWTGTITGLNLSVDGLDIAARGAFIPGSSAGDCVGEFGYIERIL